MLADGRSFRHKTVYTFRVSVCFAQGVEIHSDKDSTAHLESGQPVRMVLWKSKDLENLCNILSILSQFLVKMYEFILGLTFGGYLGKDAGAAVDAQGA